MFNLFSKEKALSLDKVKLMLESAAVTRRGQKRKINEDTVLHQSNQHSGLYIVGDGLGGYQAGDKASRLVVDSVAAELEGLLFEHDNAEEWTSSNIDQTIHQTVVKAEEHLKKYGREHPDIHRMGTTLTMALVKDNTATVANIGDSRAYFYREGHVTQITEDHSWAAALARMGKIREDEVAGHPRSNMLYRSLGTDGESDSTVDIFKRELKPGDKLLLCSDGLWHAFPTPLELAEWLDSSGSLESVVEQLAGEANRRDGSDNISAVVVSVTG